MRLTFWGTRGSIPVPGPDTVRYGGNTSCLEIESREGRRVVVDAGTGIRPLGRKLMAQEPDEINLLITHLHWDHLLGFIFFEPAYRKGWVIKLGGWPLGLSGLRGLFDNHLGDGHFPVGFDDLPAKIMPSRELEAPRSRLGGLTLRACPLNHPQGGVGFRFDEREASLVFLTDNELGGPGPASLDDFVRFCAGARVLIHDGQYLPSEMAGHAGWGHSDWASALDLARLAGVERLILTHHDPSRDDGQVDDLIGQVRRAAPPGLVVEAAAEGMVVEV